MDQVSLDRAEQIAYKILGNSFIRLLNGKNNWVFEKADTILTIPRHQRVKSYEIRVSAAKRFIEAGIPTAEPLEYHPRDKNNIEYLLVRKIEGHNIDLSKLTEAERDKSHRSAGEILKRVHSLNVKGYGRLDSKMVGRNKSWIEFISNYFQESIGRLCKNNILSLRYKTILEREYTRGLELMRCLDFPTFLHADFHIGNLLFKDCKVVGVMDLDIVSSGDSEWDTGHYSHTFNYDRNNGINSFRGGYGQATDVLAERVYSIIIWTRKLGSQAIDRPEALKETISELENILKWRWQL